MTASQTILSNLITQLRTDVINSLQANNRVAGGETIKALDILQSENEAQLLAPWWIDALEYGRKPTSPGAVKGDPTLFDRIKEWCVTKGIDVSAAYPITQHIHKFGYPGTPGVLTTPVGDDNVNMRVNEAGELLAEDYGSEIADLFNIFD